MAKINLLLLLVAPAMSSMAVAQVNRVAEVRAMPGVSISPALGAAGLAGRASAISQAKPASALAIPSAAISPAAGSSAAGAAPGDSSAAASAALDAAFDRRSHPADGAVAVDEGQTESLARTGVMWLSPRIQKKLGLTREPSYKGMSDPTVFISGVRRTGGGKEVSLVARDTAYDYAGDALVDRRGREYPAMEVVASMRMRDGQSLPSSVRWRRSGRLQEKRLIPLAQVSTLGSAALHVVLEEIQDHLGHRFTPSFRGKDEPQVFIKGFRIKNGKPVISVIVRQAAYQYNGDPYATARGVLKTVTVAAEIAYDSATRRIDVLKARWVGRNSDIERR